MVPYINWSKCDGCGKCVEICPENVFELKEFGKADFKKWHEKLNLIMRGYIRAKVINASDCIGCETCVDNCHERALELR